MTYVNKADIISALQVIDIQKGDTILVHSSLKSFGTVEGGADAVIDAFLETVGETGTVVVPTFTQKNFEDAYKTWHLDKPSDTGYITEVFRKRPEAVRSNQATHSVAAIGPKASYLTKNHGRSGLRFGIYGYTPFAAESPWQKMYEENAAVVMLGVDFSKLTFKHFCEYSLVEKCLENAAKREEYDRYVENICSYEKRPLRNENLFWPFLRSDLIWELAVEKGNLVQTTCGESTLTKSNIKPLVDDVLEDVWKHPEKWYKDTVLQWVLDNQK